MSMIATVTVNDGRQKHEVQMLVAEDETDERLRERAIENLRAWAKLGTTSVGSNLEADTVDQQDS